MNICPWCQKQITDDQQVVMTPYGESVRQFHWRGRFNAWGKAGKPEGGPDAAEAP